MGDRRRGWRVVLGCGLVAASCAVVGAAAAPASAAAPGTVVVVSSTTVQPKGSIGEAIAHCPSGDIAIGGGIDPGPDVFVVSDGPRLLASDGTVHDLEFFPPGTYAAGTVWEAVGYNTGTAPETVAVSATCVPASSPAIGPVKVVVSTTPGSADAVVMTASCPAPFEAIAGGVDVNNESEQLIVSDFPIGAGPATGWTGQVLNDTGFAGNAAVGAVCADQSGPGRTHFTMVSGNTSASGPVRLACPSGEATAAGMDDFMNSIGPVVNGNVTSALGPGVADNQFPAATQWSLNEYNPSHAGSRIAVLCAQPSMAQGGGSTGATPVRVAGDDRFLTAIAASKARFAAGTAGAVVLTRSDGFSDALAGTPLAVAKKAPLLLTPSASLDPSTEAEIKRVLPAGGTVYILGGPAAVSDAVGSALTADGFTVTRIGGANRFATAVGVAGAVGTPAAVILATGLNPGDALAGGAAAAKLRGVVVLTADASMPPETRQYLNANPGVPVDALGGPAASADPSATAIVGVDRFDTSVRAARQLFSAPASVGIVNGFAFADALAGGAAVGLLGGPLVLVDQATLPAVVHDYLVAVHVGVKSAEVYGGTASVTDGELSTIGSALQGT